MTEQFVLIKATRARLIGSRFCQAGETIKVSADLADKLVAQASATYAPSGRPPAPSGAPAADPVTPQPTTADPASTFEDIGLAGRIGAALRAHDPPIVSVEQLAALVADGTDLTAVNGIGPAAAQSIIAAVEAASHR